MKRKVLLLAYLFCTNLYASSFLGTYHCKGHDPYLNRDYTGTMVIKQQNTVYTISMKYDTGEKYRATGGQYNDELMSVVFQDIKNLRHVGLEQYHFMADKNQIGGFWVYLGEDKLGKEICTRQDQS